MEFDGSRIKMSFGGSVTIGDLRAIRHTLLQGGILIIPSDTCYSIASLPTNATSLRRIAAIEPNIAHKEIPLSFSSLTMLEKYCILTIKDYHTIDTYCPGPITLVCAMRPEYISLGLDKMIHTHENIGVRIPDSPIERQICEFIDSPITTCAIRDDSNKVVHKFDDIVSIVRKRIKNVIDDYNILAIQVPVFNYNEESTVISLQSKITGPYEIKIFREGIINPNNILKNTKKLNWKDIEDLL